MLSSSGGSSPERKVQWSSLSAMDQSIKAANIVVTLAASLSMLFLHSFLEVEALEHHIPLE